MHTSNELSHLFFHDLKAYNVTNFRTLCTCDVLKDDPVLNKSFSSVVTRFFIFAEKHPDVSELDLKLLYYKLNIDRIARYFSEYPSACLEDLLPFQTELKRYNNRESEEEIDYEEHTFAI